jgi:uncharacterized protein (DUF1800 family)
MDAAAFALNRFGLGARAQDAPPADPRGWLLGQFERYQPLPAAWSTQPRTADQVAAYAAQRKAIQAAPEGDERVAARQKLQRDAREAYVAAVGARVASALDTETPFVERLVHFWANHFAVSSDKGEVTNLAGAFEADAIRPHVLGRFEDMLVAVAAHPAMLQYLDQDSSIGPQSRQGLQIAQRNPERRRGLNENLAREILELHTLGVRTGYGQEDVTELARALTGWSLDDQGFRFRPAQHEPGTRRLLGRSYAQEGEAQAIAVLHDLSTAPDTARHVATKLARHFVADDPPAAVVERLTAAYLRSRGDLPTVYRALVEAPDTWQAPGPKFKTPWEWGVSSLRALGTREVKGPQMVALMNQLGQPVWRPGSPAGYDDVAASWAAPDALVRRVDLAQRFASQQGGQLDARTLAPRILPGALSEATAQAVARSESPAGGLALLLVSPEFLRR